MRLSTHPHMEFLVLEAALEHPKKTLEKIAHGVLLQQDDRILRPTQSNTCVQTF